MITWTKAVSGSDLVGSVGQATYNEKYAYTVRKIKPLGTHRMGRGWKYEYALFTRLDKSNANLTVRLRNTAEQFNFATANAAKTAAEEHFSEMSTTTWMDAWGDLMAKRS